MPHLPTDLRYGVDGDRRANHGKPLPYPFTARPRLGTRFYVRGCVRRFIQPLLGELTNWRSSARLSSAKLFRTCIVYCEESLTSDLNTLVPALCGAFKALLVAEASDPDARAVAGVVGECCELLGRFIAPDSCVSDSVPSAPPHMHPTPGISRDDMRLSLSLRDCSSNQ